MRSNGEKIQVHQARQRDLESKGANPKLADSDSGGSSSSLPDPKLALPQEDPVPEPQTGKRTFLGRVKKAALHGVTYDIHAVIEEDEQLGNMHGKAEVFEPRIELSFAYLQVR